jgi:nitrate/nitrite transport system ATP-binding protein
MTAFIEVSGLTKSFPARGGPRHVLADVSLTVQRGEFVSILGAMGSGKSTLLALLAGLTAPDRGTVAVDGEPIRGIRPDAGFVFQNYSLLPWFTALENVRLAVGAACPGLDRREQRARARTALERVGLGSAVHRRPRQLSGGMRQRVAIARALAADPHVLFLDEPFGALDALTRETLQQELARLCGEGDRQVTTVMVTNSVEEALLLSDRILPVVPGPPATLGEAIDVPLPRPRTAALLARDEAAAHVRAHVVEALTTAVASRRSSGPRRGAAIAPQAMPLIRGAGLSAFASLRRDLAVARDARDGGQARTPAEETR